MGQKFSKLSDWIDLSKNTNDSNYESSQHQALSEKHIKEEREANYIPTVLNLNGIEEHMS